MRKVRRLGMSRLTVALVFGTAVCTQAGTFSADFNSGAPAGMTLFGSATVVPSGGFTNSGYLQFTTTSGGDAAVLLSDLDSGAPIVSFTAQYKVLIGNPSGGSAADGMSFNFAPDLPAGTYPVSATGGAEEGAGTGYTIEFDTFLNTAPDTAPSIDVKVGAPDHSTYNGNEFAAAVDQGLVPAPEAFVDCVIQLNPNNTLTVCYDGVYVYSNLDLTTSGYSPVGASQFGIAARTGGINEDCWLDNLNIITYTNGAPFVNSFLPQGRAVATNSPIDIVLTDNTTQVNTSSIVLKLDGVTISPIITTNGGGDTFIHYVKPGGFALGSTHAVSVAFSDNASPTPQPFTRAYSFNTLSPPPVIATAKDIFTDNFESYTAGAGNASALDKNLAGGPNAAPNGSGNPWWGVATLPNLYVVGAEGGVTPHSGTNMIRGLSSGGDIDQVYYNLAYRLRGGQVLQGNFLVEWWFYDPAGAPSTTYRDYVAIDYYSAIPGDTDYSGSDAAPTRGSISQRVSLGAAPNSSTGVDYTKYQARIVGSSLGYNNGNFNTTVTRSVGWHQARIVFGPPTNNNPVVFFYIDDMVNPAVSPPPPCPTTQGFNCIEVNGAFGATDGYFDDFRVALAIPPKIVATRSGNNLVFNWPPGFTLQSASVVTGPYSDVPGATSPYRYDTTSNPQQFFRLRN